jgi:hypothetical protein
MIFSWRGSESYSAAMVCISSSTEGVPAMPSFQCAQSAN